MRNRYMFSDTSTGAIFHCLVVEVPQLGGRVIVVTKHGSVHRVPRTMLKEVPEDRVSITAAEELPLLRKAHALLNRNKAIKTDQRRCTRLANAELERAIGFKVSL